MIIKEKRMRKIITTIVLLLSISLYSQEKVLSNPEVFLKSVSRVNNSTTSISADFTQEKELSYLKDKQFSSGKFYSQGESMRWEQIKPSLYALLISPEGMKVKEDDKERAFGAAADKFLEQIKGIMLTSVNGQFAESDDFTPTYFENDNYYIVKLKPENRKLSKMFENVILEFDKTSFRLKTLRFIQKDGQSSMYFKNEVFNTTLSPTLFTEF